jgi:hypothetical protein
MFKSLKSILSMLKYFYHKTNMFIIKQAKAFADMVKGIKYQDFFSFHSFKREWKNSKKHF